MLMHGRPLVYRHHAFWRGRTVTQRAIRSDYVVVVVGAYTAISSKDRRQVAIHLKLVLWKDEASSCDLDHFH